MGKKGFRITKDAGIFIAYKQLVIYGAVISSKLTIRTANTIRKLVKL